MRERKIYDNDIIIELLLLYYYFLKNKFQIYTQKGSLNTSNIQRSVILDRVELSFLAGYFIGKGCVTFIGPNKNLYVRIGSSDKEVLETFYQTFGGKFGEQSKIRQQIYYWVLTGKRAKEFLLLMSEFMVGPKRKVVSLALNYPCGTQNHKVSPEDMSLRESLKTQIQAINQRTD